MQIKILLSIKPKFADSIFAGDKKFEYRKSIFRKTCVEKAYVYASKPVGLVIGEFKIDRVISKSPKTLWEETMNAAGISKEFFDNYFDGRNIAHALQVGATRRYRRPKTLIEMFNINQPPQSFMYI